MQRDDDEQAPQSFEYDAPLPPSSSPPHDDREDELDGMRIRQLAAVRRSGYRTRSFAIIVAVACFVVAVQLIIKAFRAESAMFRLLTVALAVLAFFGAIHFARRVAALQRELRTPPPMPPEPPGGPDFSTLSDGSQQWKNLEDIR